MSVAHEIKKIFFQSPIFQLRNKMEGQICEEKSYFVGAAAGPSLNLSNLFHEICHFAELDIKRLKKFPSRNWGFYYGKFWQIGTSWGYEPQTSDQVKRESRVWAFQLSAEKHFDLNDSAQELVKSAVWLPAFCYYKYSFNNHSDKKALYYLAKHVERLSKTFNFQKLLDDFNSRIQELEKIAS